MGFDCGFDIYPRLEANAPNKEAYGRFIEEILKRYGGVYDKKGRRTDGKILTTSPDESANSTESDSLYLWFMIGECPHIPKSPDHCDYFLRFSSKVSGCLTTPAQPYIKDVYEIAKNYFGSRVRFWHELNEFGDEQEQFGYYGWDEVYDADKKLKELRNGAQQVLAPDGAAQLQQECK
jgi:hypothetical protein